MSKKPRNIAQSVALVSGAPPGEAFGAGDPSAKPGPVDKALAPTDEHLRKETLSTDTPIDPDRLDIALFEATDDLEDLLEDITERVVIDGKPVLRLKADVAVTDGDEGTDPLDAAINALGFVRREIKGVAAEAQKRVDATIPIDVAAKLKTLATDKADLTKRLGIVESKAIEVLSAALLAEQLQKSNKSEAGVTLTVVYKDKIEIIDATKIPDEFLLPREACIDMKKLAEAMAKHNDKVAAAKTLELPEPANPFDEAAKISQSFSFTTKVPEVVG